MTPMNADLRERLRKLPGVDAVLTALSTRPLPASPQWVTALVRRELDALREDIRRGGDVPPDGPEAWTAPAVAERVRARFEGLVSPSPQAVINATGVLIHTNLGRSPLSREAISRMSAVAAGYSDLELDLERGERGSRQDHVRELLGLLTGAEDALVVNNNAAAVFLALSATARGREVVISRGELVEIGGSFRIPEILEQSGARLREVGTTNRTHLRDYERAIGPETGLLLRVHASNYRIEGFTASVPLEDLIELGSRSGIPMMVDLGSGAFLDVAPAGVRPEPRVRDIVAMGPDLVTWSGDKLLGGPQAGIVVGRGAAMAALRTHPLARVLRVDKLLLTGLQATLAAYLDEERARQEVPILAMLFEAPDSVRARAVTLAEALRATLGSPAPQVMVEDGTAAVGGGTLPLEGLRTSVVVLDPRPHTTAARLERSLRHVRPALLGRIQEERVLLDLRTVTVTEEGTIPRLVREAWGAATGKGETTCSSRS